MRNLSRASDAIDRAGPGATHGIGSVQRRPEALIEDRLREVDGAISSLAERVRLVDAFLTEKLDQVDGRVERLDRQVADFVDRATRTLAEMAEGLQTSNQGSEDPDEGR